MNLTPPNSIYICGELSLFWLESHGQVTYMKIHPKSFFQMDQQVDLSLYLTEVSTLCYSMELACLAQPCYTWSHKSFDFPDFQINFFSFHFISLQLI